jgi:hypothetical protein
MRESAVELYGKNLGKSLGMSSYKWESPGEPGVPDRFFFKEGKTLVVEFKAPGEKPRPLQRYQIKQLLAKGIPATWADCKKDVDYILHAFDLVKTSGDLLYLIDEEGNFLL